MLQFNRYLSLTSDYLLRPQVFKKALSATALLLSKIHYLDHRASKEGCCGGEQRIRYFLFLSFTLKIL